MLQEEETMNTRIFARIAEAIGKYPLLFLCALFLLWGFFYLGVPVTFYRDILAPQGERDRIYFGNNIVVSQEFIPSRGLSGIDIPIGSTEIPGNALILHIRDISSNEDIVSVPLFAFNSEAAQFQFRPLPNVPGKLKWIIEAPHSASKSFWVYREQDSSIFTEGEAYRNGKRIQGNFAFREIWQTPRIVTLVSGGSFSPSFDHFEYISALFGAFCVAALFFLHRTRILERGIVIGFIGIGIILHIWLSLSMPLIIDEGAYIQDVLQSSGTLLPFRDFLTKGPVYLFFLWVWSHVVPHTVLAWRLFSALFWALGGFVFWKLTREVGLRERSRLIAVAVWNIMPAAVALSTPLLLQTSSVVVSMLGMLLGLRAIAKSSWKIACLAALVFTVAYFIRITSAIPAFISLLFFIFFARKGWKLRLALSYVGVGITAFAIILGSSVLLLGPAKAAVLVNMEAFLISQNRQDNVAVVASEPEPFIRRATIESRLFWRTGVLLVTGLLLVPILFISRQRIVLSTGIILIVFFIAWNISIHLSDTGFLLPKKFVSTIWLIISLLFGVPLITALAALVYNSPKEVSKYWSTIRYPIIIAFWLLLTIFAYSHWGRFRQSYLTEFIPQLAIFLGVGLDFTIGLWGKIRPRWFSHVARSTLIFLVAMSVYHGYILAYRYPHTGTIDQASLVNITKLIRDNVPKNQMIFTAQPVATAFAGRQIIFGYSHPGWYREARFGTISEELRNLLFWKPEALTQYLATEAPFVLMESRTKEIYFDGYPERTEILEKNFEAIGTAENEMSGETYTLYGRR